MKKKLAKLITLFCTCALALTVALSVAACAGAGKTYRYQGCSFKSDPDVGMGDSMTAVYDTMYKDSTITVTDSEIVWKMQDQESKMTVQKDGDKYKLSGEAVDQVLSGFSGLGIDSTAEMYGQTTDAGFDLVITVTVSMSGVTVTETVTLNFVA